jgi:Fe2+ transport system protein FeoA
MTKHQSVLPLNKLRHGQRGRIHSLPTGPLRSTLIRLGLQEGEKIECLERLPGGTIVVAKNRQQIAIGWRLAQRILVVNHGG